MGNVTEKVEETVVKKRGRKPGIRNTKKIETKVDVFTEKKRRSIHDDIANYANLKRAKNKSQNITKTAVTKYADKIKSDIPKSSSKTIVHFMCDHAPLSFRNLPRMTVNDILHIDRTSGSMRGIPLITQIVDIITNGRNEQVAVKVKIIETYPTGEDYNTITIKL